MSALPAVENAKLPGAYVEAKDALEKCLKIDECEDWADREAALASYARQAHDDSLRTLATRIQARAIRRCCKLLKQRQAREAARATTATDLPMTSEDWVRNIVGEAGAAEIEAALSKPLHLGPA